MKKTFQRIWANLKMGSEHKWGGAEGGRVGPTHSPWRRHLFAVCIYCGIRKKTDYIIHVQDI